MNKEPVTPPGDARAVFISYAHADNESSDPQKRWLDQLLEILNPQEDIDICSDRDIEIGEQWHERIQAHLNAAKAVVLLVSPAFLASSYIRNSELPVILKNAAEKNVKIFPIIISPCLYEQTTFKYPDPRKGPEEFTLASIQAANPPSKTLLEMDEGERKRVLVKVAMQVRKIIPIRLQVDPAGDKLALSNIPDHNAFFTDREQVLVQVQDALAKGGRVALSGLDGVGKTQTALEYAQRHSGEYANIFWATADSREAVTSGYATIVRLLELPGARAQDQRLAVDSAKHWLSSHERWLLILDRADDPAMTREFIPPGNNGHIILTTRAQAIGTVARLVEIQKMDTEEGALFLLRRAKRIAKDAPLEAATKADRTNAKEIATQLDGLPLALDQAGAYIEETGCGFARYLDL